MDAAVDAPAACAVYRRRRPERTPLYQSVQGHLETYLALAREGCTDGDGVPSTWNESSAAIWNAAFWPTASPVPGVGSADTIS